MKLYVFLITAAVFLAGCNSTPTGNIEAFGVAAADVSSKIDDVIKDYNNTNINNKLVKMAQRNKKYVKPDFEPLKKIIIRDANKKGFALYKANKALGSYATSLSRLAKAGSRDEMAMASVKLSASLMSMNEQYNALSNSSKKLLSDKNSGTISRVIAEIATFYAEAKRADALKKIIIASDSSVQNIGNIINRQLLKGVIENRIYTMKGNELAGYLDDYNNNKNNMSFSAKKKALEAIYLKYVEMESTSATVAQARKAISSVLKAHAKLKSELEHDRFNSKAIFKAVSEIKNVHNSFDNLEELIAGCKGNIVQDNKKGIICKN